jgi:glucose dehydrogenase
LRTIETKTAIVGSGVSGTLVARELSARGHDCTLLERGPLVTWAEQARGDGISDRGPAAEPNHENASTPDAARRWMWRYVYAVGGTMNSWVGVTPRLVPEDFKMRSRYGVMRDWPLTYDELHPYYRLAEHALTVSGEANEFMPGADYPLPPHPPSPLDRLVGPHLEPFVALPQARPSRPVGGRPACCGNGRCELCPVDARFSVLNGLGHVFRRREVRLLTDTVVRRLKVVRGASRVEALECVTGRGEPVEVRASRVVVAANGIESPGLLMRSGITENGVGRFLADHPNHDLLLRTRRQAWAGHGASRDTGASYRYYVGDFRARRAAAVLYPRNQGDRPTMNQAIIDGLMDGRKGRRLRRQASREWQHTIAFSVFFDMEPDPRNRITLSSRRDRFGLPLNRLHVGDLSEYQQRASAHLLEDVPRRLKGLGVTNVGFDHQAVGTHLLGTVRMGGASDGVVDRDLRHRRIENLFVVGNAVFPTYSPANPTLTTAALAIRLGRSLAEEPV